MKLVEPSIAVPPNIIDAAIDVERFFQMNGIDDWALMGVCSRNMYEKLAQADKEQREAQKYPAT